MAPSPTERRAPGASPRPARDATAVGRADADQLAALRHTAHQCQDCPLYLHATQTVFGEGPSRPRVMLVGEQPGEQEDQAGRPFVGPAGRLLDRALAQLGWQREELYITNAVKHFKFELRGKRRLHKSASVLEALACQHWLEAEIALLHPPAIIALGAMATRALLRGSGPASAVPSVMRERGHWHRRAVDNIPVLITLHPSALLRGEPEQRDAAFAAWLADLRRADRVPD